ncbi:MAG: adenosylhomocysteinase, partial [Candidatus Bathyarchaeia archaeon]
MEYKVRDEGLHESGLKSIKWAEAHMPVLTNISKDFEKSKPLADLKIGACLHVTK